MSKVTITIASEVLSSLSPQRGMLNASVLELNKQTFNLHSLVAPTDKSSDLGVKSDDNTFVKARYVNPKTKKSFLIPIRGLLNMGIVELGVTAVKFDEGKTPTSRVHEWMLEKADAKGANLPAQFTVVSVKPRLAEGTKNVIYPAYCYEMFADKVSEMRAENPLADIGDVYRNTEFMLSLYGTKLLDRFATAEPTKDIVISI